MSGQEDITQFFGHLHPLLVHLPIGLIVLLALLEGLALFPRFKNANASSRFILALAVLFAVFSVVCGLLLSSGGSYGEHLLQWHKWTGIGTAAACCLAGAFYWLGLKRSYRVSLCGTLIALVIASHFGGSLTHGSDYLVRYAPAPLRALFGSSGAAAQVKSGKVKDVRQLQAFTDVVRPILQQNCVSCHGAEKSEGGLRLDSMEALQKGGKSGAVAVSGKPLESILVKRMQLPLTEKEHMPPEGKPQPSPAQLKVLQWWVSAGMPAATTIAELKPTPRTLQTLQSLYSNPATLAKSPPPKTISEIQPFAAKLSEDLNISVSQLSPKEPWLQVNASIAGTNFGDADLAKLSPVGPNVRWLDLAGTSITDIGLKLLASMPNLVRLHLERTATTDAGIGQLAGLSQLEYLNLFGTKIEDPGLEHLQLLPRLKQVYLWQTKVTPAAANALAEALTDNDQAELWQQEIDQLKSKINNSRISVQLGAPQAPTATSTNSPATTTNAPVNAECPVSGKSVDLAKTVLYEGKLVAFCCDDCKAKFQQDPKPLLAKLGLKPEQKDTKAGNN
jgi:uncharacterized membrane protein